MDDKRSFEPLSTDKETDVVIVGGGIAGASTAFNILKGTDLKVILLEMGKVGHGSSGRNGGQGVAVLERSFKDLMGLMGPERVARALNDIETGHWRLREMCQEVEYSPEPIETVVWSGLSSKKEVDAAIEEMVLRKRYGAPSRPLIIAQEHVGIINVPNSIRYLVTYETSDELRARLRAKESYMAAYAGPVSLVNSGRVSRQVVSYLKSHYGERFTIHEGSRVVSIDLNGRCLVKTPGGSVMAKATVLCTNGYPIPEVHGGEPSARGRTRRFVASMVGYRPSSHERPGAYIYHHEEGDPEEEPYFYLTRRPYLLTGEDLVAVGGPQQEHVGELDHDKEVPYGVYDRIAGFMSRSYIEDLSDRKSMVWNGLMAYTDDGLRIVGPDPLAEGLWYNLGCNGVGLLPSVVGGWQVAQMLKGSIRPGPA